MELTAKQIAEALEGRVEGDESIVIKGLSKIDDSLPQTLTFLANPKYDDFIYKTKASIVIVNEMFELKKELPEHITLVRVRDAYACFAQLLEIYNKLRQKEPKIDSRAAIDDTANLGDDVYIDAGAYIGKTAVIGDRVYIYPNAYIGDNVHIGDDSIVYPNVTIYHDCKIGKNCVIHAGAVIGADGFGFAPDENGVFQKVPQIGNVVLEDFVEIGANSTIDRATLGSTILRKGVKIDNLVQVAHNVEIGSNSAMAAQSGVAGSTKIGKHVLIGGQAGISGHIKIADKTQIVAQTGIPGNIKTSGKTLMGSPGIPIEDFKKSYFGFRKLPYILEKLRELEQKIISK